MRVALFLAALLQFAIPLHTGAPASSGGGGGSTAITYIGAASSGKGVAQPASTTGTLNVVAGDTLVAFCNTGGANNTITISDTASNGWTKGTHQNDASIGNTDMAYAVAAANNATDSFTCGNSTSSTVNQLIVLQFRGGSSGSPFSQQNAAGSGTWTTAAFSTTDPNSVVVQCIGSGVGVTAGTIGGVAATMAYSTTTGSYDSGCEYVIFSTAQTSITASMTASGASVYNGQMGAFR